MFAGMQSSKYDTTAKDLDIVMQKTPDDLAESLEIMMLETRPLGDARAALRGAICMLRGEATMVTSFAALHVLTALKARWKSEGNAARVLIVQRVIETLGGQ